MFVLSQVKNKRAVIYFTLIFIVSSFFWAYSRYPQLYNKSDITLLMQQSNMSYVEDTITDKATYSYRADASLYEKVRATSLNWYISNWRGMSFGLVIGTAFLSLFQYLRRRSTQNRFINSFFGMVTGTPLGMCSNCVAPITRGLFQGGAKMETALAMMFSSPMLNIIVLTMVFSVFPLYMALIKVFLSFFVILIIVPVISMQRIDPRIKGGDQASCALNVQGQDMNESWLHAFSGAACNYGKNFIDLFIRVVPLMLLAGFLGALLSHMVDLRSFIDSDVGFMDIAFASLIGTFLPLPMAVDVMLAQSLLISGVSASVVSSLLFTLGGYSIYSAIIVYRTFSFMVAVQFYVIFVMLGIVAGYVPFLF